MRFSTFQESYKLIQIGQHISQRGKRAKENELIYKPFSINNQSGFSSQSDQWGDASYTKTEKNGYKVIENGDFAYNPARINVGSIGLYKNSEPCIVSSLYVCFKTKDTLNSDYLFKYLKSEKFNKNILKTQEGGVRTYFFYDKLEKSKMWIPSIPEQQKISDFLSLIDKRIETQNKIIEDFEHYSLEIKKRMFEKHSNKKIQISNVIEEYDIKTTKNNEYIVLSSTANGIFIQSDYFNKNASSDDTTGYKVIKRGQCTYRSMSDTGTFNFNVQNIIDIGIVSPAYPVFSVKDGHAMFLTEYLNTSEYVKSEIIKMKSGGTRFALSLSKLKKISVPWPDLETRNKFCGLINTLENKLMLEKNILSNYKRQKDYLLKNLFI